MSKWATIYTTELHILIETANSTGKTCDCRRLQDALQVIETVVADNIQRSLNCPESTDVATVNESLLVV